MKKWIILVITAMIVGCTSNNQVDQEEAIFVSAATSLTEVLEQIKSVYEAQYDTKITFNYGGSGSLAQQIIQGAPVDVFISADYDFIERIEKEGKILQDTKVDVVENSLVMIAHDTSTMDNVSVEQLHKVERIAIGNPDTVPAGKYTKQTLDSIGEWDENESSFIFAKDVRQVLTYVETGNVDVGFVYASDILTSDHVKVIDEIDDQQHEKIVYPAAVIKGTAKEEEAINFIEFLVTEEAQDLFRTYGFR